MLYLDAMNTILPKLYFRAEQTFRARIQNIFHLIHNFCTDFAVAPPPLQIILAHDSRNRIAENTLHNAMLHVQRFGCIPQGIPIHLHLQELPLLI